MKNIISILILLNAFLFCGCSKNEKSNEISHFIYEEVKTKIPYKLEIGDCLNWFTSFDNIKKTVIYKNRIISVGLYGGFCCLNVNNFQVDTNLSKKLNSDLFTNISVIGDTLFSELFNEVYYLDENTVWKPYGKLKPIKYFATLLEENDYIFYFSESGEWGSILFVYNKRNGKTRALITSCPSSVINLKGEYFVSACTRHLGFWGNFIKISNIEKLKEVSDTLRLRNYSWERFYKQINDTTKNANEYLHYITVTKNNWDTAFISTFAIGERLYHFIRTNRKVYIGKITDNKLNLLDTIPNVNPENIISYASNLNIVNESFWSEGYSLIRNDTIYKISFENSYVPQEHEVSSSKSYTFNLNNENNWTAKPGQPEREIEFDFNKTYKIIGLYGNGLDGNYIISNGNKNKLKIQSDWNFIDYTYISKGNLFLNFMNLGNTEHKYNLVEITDIDKFIEKYSEEK